MGFGIEQRKSSLKFKVARVVQPSITEPLEALMGKNFSLQGDGQSEPDSGSILRPPLSSLPFPFPWAHLRPHPPRGQLGALGPGRLQPPPSPRPGAAPPLPLTACSRCPLSSCAPSICLLGPPPSPCPAEQLEQTARLPRRLFGGTPALRWKPSTAYPFSPLDP